MKKMTIDEQMVRMMKIISFWVCSIKKRVK